MSAPSQAAPPLDDFVSQLFEGAAPRRSLRRIAWLVALGLHAAVGFVALGESQAAVALPPPLEVELAAPEPPSPPPPPLTPPPPAPERETVARPAAAAPPEPARAAALLTAKADPLPTPNAEEPVDFTNDPSLLGFGSGVVAVGGRAEHGLKHAAPSLAPSAAAGAGQSPRASGDAITPVSDLSRKPGLGESDPCRGYFPSAASDDVASAAVMVTIGKDGAVSGAQVVAESPPKQGFGAAARACMTSKRFSPGLDRDGRPARTQIRVNIRFTR